MRPIPGYPGYLADELGQIWSRKRKAARCLKPRKRLDGYLDVLPCVGYKAKMTSVHRLVALAYHSNPFAKRTVNHKNGDKADNRPENLEWATYSENNFHRFKHGLADPTTGQANGMSKLSDNDVLFIRKSELSRRELAFKFSVTKTAIDKVIQRKTWAHI